MNANRIWMLQNFIGAQQTQFKIPVYQRNYDWKEKHCKRIMEDIECIINTNTSHFLGAIVYLNAEEQGFAFRECTIIDGQQRITTMMILLKALADVSKENGDKENNYQRIDETFLHNTFCDEKLKIKLKPVKTDNEQFVLLLSDKLSEMDTESNIYKNYLYFKAKIEKMISKGVSIASILIAAQRFYIVEIVLKKGEDDPQVIFESINSTGAALTQSDLIRNFLLMAEPNQDYLYDNYWLYIEGKLRKGNDYSNMDLFFKEYLVYKNTTKVKKNNLYELFIKYYEESNMTKEECLKELKYYVDIFTAFVVDNSRYSLSVRKSLISLRDLKQTTWYPFLMHVFDDYEKHQINEDTLEKTMNFLVVYLLRRVVCEVKTNTLRTLFIYLYGKVFKVPSNKEKYYESINKYLHNVPSVDIMPQESDFINALKKGNVYKNKPLCKYLLSEIENGDSKEILDVSTLTIEHIMPQTLNNSWKHISDETHRECLHVLGNLTVTGYNSELSNKSFVEKQKIIREYSKAVELNRDVLNANGWGEKEIVARSERLAKIVNRKHNVDIVTDNSIKFEELVTITRTLDDDGDFSNEKLYSFKFEEDEYRQNKYSLMLVDVIRFLDTKKSGILEKLAARDYTYRKSGKHPYISYNKEDMSSPLEVKDGIFVESHMDANSLMKFIGKLMDEYEFDKSLFSISIIAKGEDESYDEDDDEDDE